MTRYIAGIAAFLVLCGVVGWLAGTRLAEAAADGRIFGGGEFVNYGSWRITQALGSPDSDPVLRAWIARTGILPLARSEVAYFFTDTAPGDAPLDGGCDYEVRVPEIGARWWSLAAYDADHKPIANRLERYSINSDAGHSRIVLSRAAPAEEDAWLPLGEADRFELLFRVYQPDTTFDPAAPEALPAIERIGPC
ncbi:DUF1214 domain-containing protein [Erythrobacter sp. HL-111]|uniref:DUF1214 domain-containing protein n=1 Tax=Erythrobacter sp. HL-111 TaxID=1798193 RepID=UPI0006DAA183|nr:DUF1214 domain-containing protein [Erythrobacter sp. HL-111]KPP81448.1 MAG: hypothetical protein HLUCCO15_14485 [Erythrobacteraceae bacterium HL-111]SDS96462.1 hypothetical protein SAMN04515621_2611 [Erythrobacter sp. HL-111]